LNAASVLRWDQRTMMPATGAATRGQQIATLVGIACELLLSDATRRAVDAAAREVAAQPEDSPERREVAQAAAGSAFHSRVPAALLKRKAALAAVANAAWIEARATSNFALFKPHLEEVMSLSRAYADAIGYAEHPYDALVSIYEPGETVASLRRLFAALR